MLMQLLTLLPALGALSGTESATDYFPEVQSFLADLGGTPLISANWSGRYRPYQYRESKFVFQPDPWVQLSIATLS